MKLDKKTYSVEFSLELFIHANDTIEGGGYDVNVIYNKWK
jgi:hypothetical protein